MAKKLVFILVMVVLVAGLGITLIILGKDDSVTTTPAYPESAPMEYLVDLWGDEFGGIASLTVINSTGEYTILGGDPPYIPGWESVISGSSPLEQLISMSSSINTQGLVAEKGANLAVYGLDHPRAELRIQPNQGEGAVLYIGNEAPDNSSVYILKEGDGAVHRTGKWNVDMYLQGIFDFVDRTISPAGQDNGEGGFVFDRITLGGTARTDGPVTISYIPEETAPTGLIKNEYHISGPIETMLNMEAGYNILKTIMGLQGDTVIARVAGDRDLAAYGLDRPYATASVSGILGQGLGGFNLRASKPDANGNVYIFREGTELVYQIAASTIPWIEAGWWDLMGRMVIVPFIDEVAQVEIITPARQVAFNLSGEGSDLKVEAQGNELNSSYFRRYYQTLLAATYDEYTEERIPSGTQPFLEIVYHYRNDQRQDRLSFYGADSRRPLVSLNGNRPFYTFSSYTGKVLSDLGIILENRNVLPYL
ncbi:MAG: DUF4340 domain-containing protein [Treponema sp.]|jgi:hypothetical protein|nr:DUF4340 domain-containing protein [Treponema sp.]